MVHRLVVSYGTPEDPAAFDAHYRDVHAPLARQMPGLVRFTVGHPSAMDPSQPAPYLVAELDFDSEAAMGAAFASAEGQAAAADVPGFATGGATMTHYDVQTVS
ncbi:EthD family reductase [Blastococcus sp. TF02A-35]|uniref:EthD family reductase n=1 Tax=Blastococcus sp. TF02A-35 TaxID=2559612 RepID=UPI0010743538|nr:EthD family reductase [Blastococcus sp. TF02A_35]TFV52888.1 EthD family reductase [Blastococcus sp. TF02A_35]